MRLGVYTDYPYHLVDGEVHAERAFAAFVASLAPHFESLTLVGRMNPDPRRGGYPLGRRTRFVPLPFYESLARPRDALRTVFGALRGFWKALAQVDAVWILGPHGFAIPFVLLALLRRKRVVLGVRQELIPYVRSRHPGRRGLVGLAVALEGIYRALARWVPVIVVGPGIGRGYRAASDLLEIVVSMVRESEIVDPTVAKGRSYDGDLTVLSVGRLETEKNPLLLADILARLRQDSPRWRLVVCGEGPLKGALVERLEEFGVADAADIRGYVPIDDGLLEMYRESSIFLHVSWTEGMPQVVLEAFAAGLPSVATDVGGVREAVGAGVRLISPGDAEAAVKELELIADDPELRNNLIDSGVRHVSAHTIEIESRKVADFISGGPGDKAGPS